MDSTQVVIIGGGATGAGLLWDLSLRGIPAVLLEQRDLANGATGRCHGLLHSGGRYAVKDPEAAAECIAENRILKRIAPHCVEDCGGLFVQCRGDDPTFFEQWRRAAATLGIPSSALTAEAARALEPNLAPDQLGAFTTPDAHVDVFRLVQANLEAALARGARVRTYAEVRKIDVQGGRVRGVLFRDTRSGEEHELHCEVVVNASGGWAREVAALAGVDVPLRCDKGSLLVLNHRLSGRVLNRCRKAGDGDILVPAGPVCILGTSSITVPGPEGLNSTAEEIHKLLRLGEAMVPALAEARVMRVFAGVRPLYIPSGAAQAAGRQVSRGFVLLDHGERDGVDGFFSVLGGKLTTYRLMAARAADAVAAQLGVDAACSTDVTPLRADAPACTTDLLPAAALEKLQVRRGADAAHIVESIRSRPALAEMVCECELVSRAELDFILQPDATLPVATLADVGRRTRLGFGPCQGTFCGFRAMLAGFQDHRWSAEEAAAQLREYIENRRKGQLPIPEGRQLDQMTFGRDIYDLDPGLEAELNPALDAGRSTQAGAAPAGGGAHVR